MREKEEQEGIAIGLMTWEILHLGIQVHQLAMMLTRSKASTDSWLETPEHISQQDNQM